MKTAVYHCFKKHHADIVHLRDDASPVNRNGNRNSESFPLTPMLSEIFSSGTSQVCSFEHLETISRYRIEAIEAFASVT